MISRLIITDLKSTMCSERADQTTTDERARDQIADRGRRGLGDRMVIYTWDFGDIDLKEGL